MFGIDTAKLIFYGVIAIAAMILLGLIYNAIGNHFTAPLKVELKACQQATETAVHANAQLQSDLATLKQQVADQNKQVADIQAQSDKRVADSQAALAAAKARAASMQVTMDSLHRLALAPSIKTGCPDVDKVLTDLADDRVRYGPSLSQPSAGNGNQGAGNGSLRVR